MDQKQYLYESTFIVNATLEDHQVEAIISRTQEIITKDGGEVKAVNRWGRKRLAYPIKKKNNGFYVNMEFSAPGTVVKQLEHAFSLDEHVLRFLSVRVDAKALKARQLAAQKLAAEAVPVTADVPIEEIEKVPLFEDEEEGIPPK